MTAMKRGNKIEDWRKCKVVKLADGASSRRSQAKRQQLHDQVGEEQIRRKRTQAAGWLEERRNF